MRNTFVFNAEDYKSTFPNREQKSETVEGNQSFLYIIDRRSSSWKEYQRKRINHYVKRCLDNSLKFLKYPAVICIVLVAVISVTLLITKGKMMRKEVRVPLIILGAIAVLIIALMIFLAFVFGPSHPAATPNQRG